MSRCITWLWRRIWVGSFIGVLLLAGLSLAHVVDEKPAVLSVSVVLEPDALRLDAGHEAMLTVRVTVPEGHHAYVDEGEDGFLIPVAMDFSSLEAAGIRVVVAKVPTGETDREVRATVLRGEGEYLFRLRATSRARVSNAEYAIPVTSQICDDGTGKCYSPKTVTARVEVEVLSVPEGEEPAAIVEGAGGPSEDSRGIAVWMLLAFVAGMILNVMPCVLPVVSIKVLSFVQQAGESRGRVLALGVAFAVGMMVVFEALALLAIFAGKGWGEQFQEPAFLIVMTSVIFAFALSLFGVFEFRVPLAVSQWGSGAPREGLSDAFFKGIMATVLATPCSGPFLGSTLAWALRQSNLTILAVFTMLGLGMALPYVALTASPRLLKFLPKPGAWMETFKHVMGFFLLGTVVWLLVILDTERLRYTLAFLLFVGLGCWLWGRYALRMSTQGGRLAVLPVALLVVVVGGWISFVGFPKLFSDPEFWEPFDLNRLAQYQREGRNIFVDFTADWCANCKTNEAFVFNTEDVRALIESKRVVAMKADLTREGPETEAIRAFMEDNWSARSIPFMVLYPADRPDAPDTRHGLVSKQDIVKLFEALPDPD